MTPGDRAVATLRHATTWPGAIITRIPGSWTAAEAAGLTREFLPASDADGRTGWILVPDPRAILLVAVRPIRDGETGARLPDGSTPALVGLWRSPAGRVAFRVQHGAGPGLAVGAPTGAVDVYEDRILSTAVRLRARDGEELPTAVAWAVERLGAPRTGG